MLSRSENGLKGQDIILHQIKEKCVDLHKSGKGYKNTWNNKNDIKRT